MPEDSLPAVRNAVGRGKFYGNSKLIIVTCYFICVECPRGHPYFISEVRL